LVEKLPDLADGSPQAFTPDAANARAFRDALGCFTTGVTVVTCMTDDGPLGITANSFSSLSLDPPLVLWSPARSSRRFQPFHDAQQYAIHILADTQDQVCFGFAKQGDAFDGIDWELDAQGIPHLGGCLARFACKQHAVHEGGDHAIIVGQVMSVTTNPGTPLVFSSGSAVKLAR